MSLIYNNRLVSFKGKIVIFRHLYDIAGMITDRCWTSCMNLDKGKYKEYISSSIINGTLIAYLVNENDTNINKPIARVLIKPYIIEDSVINFDNPNWLLKVSCIYRQNYKKFPIIVQKWLDDNWNNKIKNENNKNTLYKLHDGSYKEHADEKFF